jgi:hypothetical protein
MALFLAFIFKAGAASDSKWVWPNTHPRSGFEGTILVKAICPNMPPPDITCPFYAAHADFSVFSDLGESVGTFASDGSGFFRVGLKPGSYVIAPRGSPDPSPLPLFRAFKIIVPQQGFVEGTLRYDFKTSFIFWGVTLDGAHADPPNSSPLLASANVVFGNRYLGSVVPPGVMPLGVFASNFVSMAVYSTASASLGDLTIRPNTATIRDEAGNILMDLPRILPSPNDLSPGCDTCPQITRYGAIFNPSLSQTEDLVAGCWYVQISAVTDSGEDYPAGAIRGQIAAQSVSSE